MMSKPKYSPAPWSVELDSWGNSTRILDKNGKDIAYVWSVLDKHYDLEEGTHTTYIPHANAALVADALETKLERDEMLVVLHQAKEFIEDEVYGYADCDTYNAICDIIAKTESKHDRN